MEAKKEQLPYYKSDCDAIFNDRSRVGVFGPNGLIVHFQAVTQEYLADLMVNELNKAHAASHSALVAACEAILQTSDSGRGVFMARCAARDALNLAKALALHHPAPAARDGEHPAKSIYDNNPECPQCHDTPSCGSGSWRWNGTDWEHRCEGVLPQAGHWVVKARDGEVG